MIFIIDDDEIMVECVARMCGEHEVRTFANGIEAMQAISDGELPDLIFLDIMLDGPDGFTFLNEMISYEDTRKIPIVVVTSLSIGLGDLVSYNVAGLLKKDEMRPQEVKEYVEKFAK